DARGRIPEDHARGYRELGAWMAAHAEAVYGTRPAGLTNGAWGGAVTGEDAVYFHAWNRPPDGTLVVEAPSRAVTSLETVPDGREAAFEETDGLLTVTLPPAPEGEAMVLKARLSGEPRWSKIECEDYVPGGEGFGYHAPTTWTPGTECYRKDDVGCTL